jgi:hypothetical protein
MICVKLRKNIGIFTHLPELWYVVQWVGQGFVTGVVGRVQMDVTIQRGLWRDLPSTKDPNPALGPPDGPIGAAEIGTHLTRQQLQTPTRDIHASDDRCH